MLLYNDLDQLKSGKKLLKSKKLEKLSSKITAARVKQCVVQGAAGWSYSYAAKLLDDQTLALLQELSDEQQLIEKYQELLKGAFINVGENRMVLHHLTRGICSAPVSHQGKDLAAFYTEQNQKIKEFSQIIHDGKLKSSSNKRFDTVVQIGIGGSDLGPRAMVLALENWVVQAKKERKMKTSFISNVDPDDANAILASINLETSLFILVSKSGTTLETLANETFVRSRLQEAGLQPDKHMIVVTSQSSPLAKSPRYLASFFIDDFIGGRFSSTSAVGGALISLSFGYDVFEEFLYGAHEADLAALEKNIFKNLALLDALIGVWERNALGFPATAILPYSQALSRFPAHLQQLDMESNGKSVNRKNERIHYATGPLVFGEPGTNGQHSFYQLLHQGTDIIPLQFIGFLESQSQKDVISEGSSSQTKLNANLAAQIVAFAHGSPNKNGNKNFEGRRPSSLLLNQRLTPRTLGALLAHFENKIMFQGFLWNVNSFDQEGVQLGKILTQAILTTESQDEALEAFAQILGLRKKN